jgi:two-component system chemotaxis response regulator CheB
VYSARKKRFEVVGIASSAGGIKALMSLLSQLPPDFPGTVLVAQHLPLFVESQLVEILAARTALPVKWGRTGDLLEKGTVFVAPQRSQLTVSAAGRLKVAYCPRAALGTPSADPLFYSLARRFGRRAIGIVLTGSLWDGAAGIQEMKRRGSTVLIQDPATALADGMPVAAMETTGLHFVLPLNRIAFALSTLMAVPEVVRVLTTPNFPLRYWLRYVDNSGITSDAASASRSRIPGRVGR